MKRYKKRYFLVRFFEEISKEQMNEAVCSTFKKLFGEINFALANIKMIYYANGLAVFRCNNEFAEEFKASIFALSYGQNLIQAKVDLISGTLRKMKKKLKT